MLLITVSYLVFVLKLGPELMNDQKPLNIKSIILVYNLYQTISNIHIVSQVSSRSLYYNGVVTDMNGNFSAATLKKEIFMQAQFQYKCVNYFTYGLRIKTFCEFSDRAVDIMYAVDEEIYQRDYVDIMSEE